MIALADNADAAVITAWAASVVFVIGYTFKWPGKIRAPWWRYRVGRAMVSLDVALMLALLPTVLRLVLHLNASHFVFFTWYFIVSLYVVAATTLWRLRTITYVQSHPGVDEAPADLPPEEIEAT